MAAQHVRRTNRKWHVAEKAVLDHLVRNVSASLSERTGVTHAAVTATGLLVEEQVRKAWNRSPNGLAMF